MSIDLMSAIFRTEFMDLQDSDGNNTKASTAKFVCLALADHANDEGEGAYPSINKIAYKTSLSRTAVINALDALKFNGIITSQGISKRDTINYTVNPKCFSGIGETGQLSLPVNPVDPPQSTQLTPPVNPVDPNHPLTIQESSYAETLKPTARILRGEDEQSILDGMKISALIEMASFPGAKREARIQAVLDYASKRLNIRTTSREWADFAKAADRAQIERGERVEKFFDWLLSQKGFDPSFWRPSKMTEHWPRAFAQEDSQELQASAVETDGNGYIKSW